MQQNSTTLLEFATRLILEGYSVLSSKESPISFIIIMKGDQQCSLGFKEVPYRWSIHADIPATIENGSGRVLKTFDGPDFEVTIKDIENNMLPMPVSRDKYIRNNLTFLKSIL